MNLTICSRASKNLGVSLPLYGSRSFGSSAESSRSAIRVRWQSHVSLALVRGRKKTDTAKLRHAESSENEGGKRGLGPIDRCGDARTTFARMRDAIYHAIPGNTRAAIISTVVAFRAFRPSSTRAKIEEHGCLQLLGTDEWQNASKLSQRGILLNFCVEWCGPPLLARPVPHHLSVSVA